MGDDTVVYDTAGTFGAHGGAGADTLAVTGSGIDLNLTAIADFDITGFEVIDLTGRQQYPFPAAHRRHRHVRHRHTYGDRRLGRRHRHPGGDLGPGHGHNGQRRHL